MFNDFDELGLDYDDLLDNDGKKESIEDKQLLRLTIQQALQSQYVLEHTRGIDRFLSPDKETTESDNKAEHDITEENEHTLATLVGKALEEAKNRHVTAGFSSISDNVAGDLSHFVTLMERLGRELSAIGLSADSSFLSLTNKRAVILDRIVTEYQKEYRIKGMASLTTKDLSDTTHSLLKITVGSGVFMMLTMLENSAHSNPKMCLKILTFLKLQLSGVDPCELATSLKLPIPAIAESAFDSVHETLMNIALDDNVKLLLRTTCLELLLQISVTRGTLNTLLSVIYLLLFKFDRSQVLKTRPSLVRLREMRREIRLDLPSYRNQILKASIMHAVGGHTTMTTDGSYLYLHSSKGLFKIGTGVNNTSPGFVIGEIRGYRSSEKASLACVHDKLYYRSSNIAPASLIVLSTDTLTEIGHVLRNGKGTFKTADNSGTHFGYTDFQEDELGKQMTKAELEALGLGTDADIESTKPKEDDGNDAIRRTRAELRSISQRMTALENAGMYDGGELDDLEDRYDELLDSLPIEYQEIDEFDDDTALFGAIANETGIADDESSDDDVVVSTGRHGSSNKKSKKKKKKDDMSGLMAMMQAEVGKQKTKGTKSNDKNVKHGGLTKQQSKKLVMNSQKDMIFSRVRRESVMDTTRVDKFGAIWKGRGKK